MPPKTARTLVLQSRDLAVLAGLGEHGILDTDLIHGRYFASVSRRRCLQRLAAYQEQGLTRVANLTLWTAGTGRSAPVVHCLTERGAETVEALTGVRPLRVSRGDPKPETIHHRLQIVRTRLVIDDACDKLGLAPPHWILEQDRDPAAAQALSPSQRRLLYHAFPAPPVRCTCQPDAACRLAVPRDITRPAAGTTDLIGFFEIDCSTEGRKQIVGKLPGYARLIQHHSYTRYFSDSADAVVRVFWICRTWERVDSLWEKLGSEPVAQYFRFAVEAELNADTALTSPLWHAVDGKRREIIRLPHRK